MSGQANQSSVPGNAAMLGGGVAEALGQLGQKLPLLAGCVRLTWVERGSTPRLEAPHSSSWPGH